MNVAQYNLAMLKAPAADLPDFLDEVARVNAIGDAAPGFVWRYASAGDENSLSDMVGPYIINLTVWKDVDSLWDFTFSGDHLDMLRRRRDWFVPNEMTNILWYVRLREYPSPEEAEARMAYFWEHGPSPVAWTFKSGPGLRSLRAAGTVLE